METSKQAITISSEVLTEIRMTLEHVNERMASMDRRQTKLEQNQDASRSTDWRLWVAIVAMVGGSVSWSWSQITTSTQQSMVPINQDLGYARQDRSLLMNKILEESSDRKVDIGRIDGALEERRDWMEKMTETVARHDERHQSLRNEIDAQTDDRFRASQHADYAKLVDARFAAFQKQLDNIFKIPAREKNNP